MPLDSTNIENDPQEARLGSPAAGSSSKGALSEMAQANAAPETGGGKTPLSGLLNRQISQLEKSRSEKKAVIDEAIKNLSARETPQGATAEELFRLMGAFAAPTKTGSFFETLGNAGNVGADILGKRRESKTALEDLKTKYKLQGIDVDSEHLKELIDAQKALQAENAPSSIYGKTAKDEGLQPGTPAFNARVAELAAADLANKTAKAQGPQVGAFDTKTGNFVAPNGTVIKANEIKEDRAARDSIVKLQDSVKQITPDVIKKAEGWDWTTGDTSKYIAGKVMPQKLSAQTKINAAGLQERLKNLPPGPASDKDISQARSSFPGFSDAKALEEWVRVTNVALDNYLKRQDEKYGSVQWYGSGATPGAPSGANKPPQEGTGGGGAASPGGVPPASPVGRPSNQAAPGAGSSRPAETAGAPRVGAVYKGHEFLGGDPKDKANWKKV